MAASMLPSANSVVAHSPRRTLRKLAPTISRSSAVFRFSRLEIEQSFSLPRRAPRAGDYHARAVPSQTRSPPSPRAGAAAEYNW
jgi:hypothetical protein